MLKDRRSFLQAATLAAVASTVQAPAQDAKAGGVPIVRGGKPSNVVLMICDDLGYGDLGSYGSRLPTTHLDNIAQNGLRFTHCNSGHPICSASRAALMTGRYAPRSHTIGAYFPGAPGGMDRDEQTLANLFHSKGFKTHAVGKWHLGNGPEYQPTSRGFDSYLGVPYSDDMAPLPLIRNLETLEADTDRTRLTPLYTESATSFLKEHGASPFFLYVAYSYPHDPARASDRFRGKSGFGDFGDAVMEIDWSVGEVVKTLKEIGQFDDTLILFTSDHGPWFQGSPGLVRGRKGSTFEGGLRVPLLAHWPHGIAPGVVDEWISNLDWVPTLSSMCDLPRPAKPLDGLDISAKLHGGVMPDHRETILYFAPQPEQGKQVHCARKGEWKLRVAQVDGEIYTNDRNMGHTGFWLPNPELYNLQNDPLESYSVESQNPEMVREILADIDRLLKTFPSDTIEANAKLRVNVASHHTPPGAGPRIRANPPQPALAYEPPGRGDT